MSSEENKNATRAMQLGFASVICGLTSLPAIAFGVLGLLFGNTVGRGRAWIGIVTGTFFLIVWTGAYFVGEAQKREEEQQAQLAAQRTEEAAKVARQKAAADAPRRIEEARASIAAGNSEVALPVTRWLRSNGLDVPKDLHDVAKTVLAKESLEKAKAAAAQKRWAEALQFATEAKGADAAMDVEAEQVIAKAKPVVAREVAERAKAAAVEERRAKAQEIADMQRLAAAVHKQAIADRKEFAKGLETRMLRRGMDVTVTTRGEGATVLHVDWVLCSKVTVFQLTDGANGTECQQAGFTRVECSDGYDGTWGVNFK